VNTIISALADRDIIDATEATVSAENRTVSRVLFILEPPSSFRSPEAG
jgi:hypothetical protein